jgi:hypothetical protein
VRRFISVLGPASAALIVCGLLCAGFAVAAGAAAGGKSSTADEPEHSVVGWFALWKHDYRFSTSSPPLWQTWVALGSGADDIHYDPTSDAYRNILPGPLPIDWRHMGTRIMVARGRMLSLVLGVLLAVVIGRWAWELGGVVPAAVATFLYCLDPNFLGHAPLMKSDVPCALFYTAAAYAIWRAGRRLTWASIAAAVIVMAMTAMIKFSGSLAIAALILLLAIRAISSAPWLIFGRLVHRRAIKLAAATGVSALTIVVTYAVIWACYGFRFNAGPDGLTIPMQPLVRSLGVFALNKQLGRNPTADELAAWTPPPAALAVLWAEQNRLIPQAYAAGLLYTQVSDQGELDAYLLGQHYKGGDWRYFPLAAIFKEPLATLVALLAALVIGAWAVRGGLLASWDNRWSACALAIPAGLYAWAAIQSQINIGYRHFFPVLPFIFIAVALAMARISGRAVGCALIALLAVGLFTETAAAYPNFIAFFNAASMPHRFWLLSDSNLDWGQDLPLLAAWQRAHPGVPLYLEYFGPDDPAEYGIQYLPAGGRILSTAPRSAVVAISATYLQFGTYDAQALAAAGVDPRSPPEKILGGTLYLFRVNPKAAVPRLQN